MSIAAWLSLVVAVSVGVVIVLFRLSLKQTAKEDNPISEDDMTW
jgi:capsular polysaccharide biosynthesis protein